MPPPNTRNKYLLAHGLMSKTTVGSLEGVSEAVIQADSLLWKWSEEKNKKERCNKVNHKCDKAL